MHRTWAVTLLALAACGGPKLTSATEALDASPHALSFTRTFIGYPQSEAVLVENLGAASLDVKLAVDPPFSVDSGSFELSGGESKMVQLTFSPTGAGAASGTLSVTTDSLPAVTVALTGTAASAPVCTPSNECHLSRFDPTQAACINAAVADGAACGAANLCLVGASCLGGQCVGETRSCDDDDICTQDACDPAQGCVHVSATAACPQPSDPCHVATCDPSSGCGIDDAPDWTPCGSMNCTQAHVCFSGACLEVTPPDGVECAPASPCQAHGTCQSGSCVQPAAAALQPEWTYDLPDDGGFQLFTQGVMADDQGNLYLSFHESTYGPDGGLPVTHLLSLTADGSERFHVLLPQGWGLLGVDHGLAFVDARGLVALSTADGGVVFQNPAASAVSISVAQDTAVTWWFDYGMELERNGDVVAVSLVDGGESWRLPGEHYVNCPSGPWYGPCATGAWLTQPISDGSRFFLYRHDLNDAGDMQGELAIAVDGQIAWEVDSGSEPDAVVAGSILTDSDDLLDPASGQRRSFSVSPSLQDRLAVGNDRIVWRSGYLSNPDGGSGKWVVTEFDAQTGAETAEVFDESGLLQLMANGSVLVESWTGLTEIAESGTSPWSCAFPTSEASYQAPTWGWSTVPLLTQGHYVRIAMFGRTDLDPMRYRVESYALPGIDLATHGWVTYGGNPGRTLHPR